MNRDHPLFPYDRWEPLLGDLAEKHRSARPFPHTVLNDFLDADDAERAMREFPKPSDTAWIRYRHFNENKLGKSRRDEFPPFLGRLVDELNSPEFLRFLTNLTGIDNLLADEMLDGGGLHQTASGGFLNIHADFTTHHYRPWRRRVNLILYLNEGWREEWNGSLELWASDMKRCIKKIAPILNTAVIFDTDEFSYHGLPDRLVCPEGVTRKSLALYYYAIETDRHRTAKSTNYRSRPGDGWKSPLIWLDKKAVHLYSLAKSRLGLSDRFISRILGRFGKGN